MIIESFEVYVRSFLEDVFFRTEERTCCLKFLETVEMVSKRLCS